MPTDLDADLDAMDLATLRHHARELRAAIRTHRDSQGHELCWHHPALWNLLPDKVSVDRQTPPWPEFIQRCAAYRASLDSGSITSGR